MTFLIADGDHAVERGPRLHRCAALIRRAVQHGAADRARATSTGCPAIVIEQMGRCVPRARRARRRDRARRARRRRSASARRSSAGSRCSRSSRARRRSRRGRVQARRHLRLPDRADRRARRGARPGGRHRRLPRADGRAPRDLARRRRVGRPQRAAELRDARAGFTSEFVGYEKTDVLTADRRARGARRRALPREARASRRSTPPAAARSPTPASSSSTRRRARARRCVEALPVRRRPGARLRRATGFAAGDRVRARRAVVGALPDDGEPHGDAPAARGAARGARRPRQAGGLGRAARQAALRLHARPAR